MARLASLLLSSVLVGSIGNHSPAADDPGTSSSASEICANGLATASAEAVLFRQFLHHAAYPFATPWPTICTPGELIDRLIDAGMGPFRFYCWDDDFSKPVFADETAACSSGFPFMSTRRPSRQLWADSSARLRRDFPRLAPRWVWFALYGETLSMGGYELSSKGTYRLLSSSEAHDIVRQAAQTEGEALSMAAMIDMIYAERDADTVVLFSADGESETNAVFTNALSGFLSPDAETALRKMKQRQPAYIGFRNFLDNSPGSRFYILQKDGSYKLGCSPITFLLDWRAKDPIYRQLFEEKLLKRVEE